MVYSKTHSPLLLPRARKGMKLAQALVDKAALQNKITDLRDRLCANGKIQEGDETAEDLVSLGLELEECLKAHQLASKVIHRMNHLAHMDPNTTIAEGILKKNHLTQIIATYRHILTTCSLKVDRFSRNEIKQVVKIDLAEVRKKIDEAQAEKRRLDLQLQEANWNTDLVE